MNKLYTRYLFIAFFILSPMIHAQWFYEMGVSRNTFEDYSVNSQQATTPVNTNFIPYKGMRDLSFNIGYLFSFSKKDPLEMDYRPPFFRLGVGTGFDQMNIRTNAEINGLPYPTNYALAQFQGRVGLHLTPFVFYSDKSGQRVPTFSINLHGGAAFNQFTSAIRQGANTSVDLLHDGSEFDETYLSFHYGAGFQIFLNNTTQFYVRYTVDNSAEFVENSVIGNQRTRETYKLHKNKLAIGVMVDFKLINRIKQRQQDKIDALASNLEETNALLEQAQMAPHDHDALDDLKTEIENLKKQLSEQPKIDETALKTEIHETGVRYFPEFKEIRFGVNSSFFDEQEYAPMFVKLATFLTHNPNLTIHLVGYADQSGSASYNMELSKKRAERVRDHLVKQYNVPTNQILAEGKGETSQFSITSSSVNRRTEIIILD